MRDEESPERVKVFRLVRDGQHVGTVERRYHRQDTGTIRRGRDGRVRSSIAMTKRLKWFVTHPKPSGPYTSRWRAARKALGEA